MKAGKEKPSRAPPLSRSLVIYIGQLLIPGCHGANGARVALLCQLPTSPPVPQIAVRIVPHAAFLPNPNLTLCRPSLAPGSCSLLSIPASRTTALSPQSISSSHSILTSRPPSTPPPPTQDQDCPHDLLRPTLRPPSQFSPPQVSPITPLPPALLLPRSNPLPPFLLHNTDSPTPRVNIPPHCRPALPHAVSFLYLLLCFPCCDTPPVLCTGGSSPVLHSVVLFIHVMYHRQCHWFPPFPFLRSVYTSPVSNGRNPVDNPSTDACSPVGLALLPCSLHLSFYLRHIRLEAARTRDYPLPI